MAEWSAFAAPELFTYMEACISDVRDQILSEMRKDPVPQFNRSQIQANTAWLKAALQAMREFISRFRGPMQHVLSDAELDWRLKAARDSSRMIAVHLSNEQSKFKGSQMASGLTFRLATQADNIRDKLNEMKRFLTTFGCAQWLGNLATPDYCEKQKSVLAMLDGLLSPEKSLIALPPIRPSAFSSSGSTPEVAKKLKAEFGNRHNLTGEAKLELLLRTCELVSQSVKKEQERMGNVKAELEGKMDDLRDFAQTLSEMPETLNEYLLSRLGEIEGDSSALKQWIREEKAREIHSMLEAFRDAAIQEKAVREMMARMQQAQ